MLPMWLPFHTEANAISLYLFPKLLKKIAEIKGLSESEVAEAIIANAKRVFDI